MLLELNITNLVLIESCRIEFPQGFICISGESGAGKSVFLSALKLLSGDKASKQLVRKGCDKANVEGIFTIDQDQEVIAVLHELELDHDDELVLSREILSNGKSRCRINGTMVPLNLLQRIGRRLVQLHGQSEQTLLRDTRTHLEILDRFDPPQEIEPFKKALQEMRKKQKELDDLSHNLENLLNQRDFIEFQFNELEKADFKPGEEDQLNETLGMLESSEQIVALKQKADEYLSWGNPSIESSLEELKATLEELEEATPATGLSEKIKAVLLSLEEVKDGLADIKVPEEFQPQELDRLYSRLAKIQQFKRKFRLDYQGILDLFAERKRQLEILADSDGEKQLLLKELDKLGADALKYSQDLHEHRLQAAQKFDQAIQSKLQALDMPRAEFSIQVHFDTDFRKLQSSGADSVEFFVRLNPGEDLRPLSQTLSGGELSRVMLALKAVMAHRDQVPVLVFDEVDSGISGETAHGIANTLQELGQYHQVLTITHLHQVASRAENQILVEKFTEGELARTVIRRLDSEERVSEMARMLGGRDQSATLEHARQLLGHG